MTIKDFVKANSSEFDTYERSIDWNGYTVYYVNLKSDIGACVGYPRYALEKEGVIRRATLDEVMAIMDAEIATNPEEE